LSSGSSHFDAVYLHARLSRDARVAFYAEAGAQGAADALPSDLRDRSETVDCEVLLPTEESTLRALTAVGRTEDRETGRVVPGLWRLPACAVPLDAAVPYLAGMSHALDQPGLCFLIHASRFALALAERGDFAPADEKSFLHWLPALDDEGLRCLRAVAELVPDFARTARVVSLGAVTVPDRQNERKNQSCFESNPKSTPRAPTSKRTATTTGKRRPFFANGLPL